MGLARESLVVGVTLVLGSGSSVAVERLHLRRGKHARPQPHVIDHPHEVLAVVTLAVVAARVCKERRAQAEAAEKQKASSGSSSSSGPILPRGLTTLDRSIVFGKDRKAGAYLMAPELLKYLGDELKNKSEVLKNLRKFREEQKAKP